MNRTEPRLRPAGAILPLKDALRAVRFTMKRGRSLLHHRPPPIPSPLESVARSVLSEVDSIAERVNKVAARLVHRFLDAPDAAQPSARTLESLARAEGPDVVFAQTAYRALAWALVYLGAADALVSEVSAAEAYAAAVRSSRPAGDPHAEAAALMDEMLRREVVRDVILAETSLGDRQREAELPALAIFALILCLLSEPAEGDEDAEALLAACCDMARALRSDIMAAGHDEARLRALIAAYAGKI